MNDFIKKNWIGIVLILGAVIGGIIAYQKGWLNPNRGVKKNPNSPVNDGTDDNQPLTNQEASGYATSVYNTFVNNWSYFGSIDEAHAQLELLNNMTIPNLTRVHNAYIEKYSQNGEYNTIKDLISAEWLGWNDTGYLRDELVKKMIQNNL